MGKFKDLTGQKFGKLLVLEFLVNFKNTYGDEYEGEMSCLDWIKSEVDN